MRCLASIPVREDIQVIVIDDCSPGADKYLETYPELEGHTLNTIAHLMAGVPVGQGMSV